MNRDTGLHPLQVLQRIIRTHPEVQEMWLIRHEVMLNWGQKYNTNNKILQHFEESLVQEIPLEWRVYERDRFLDLSLNDLRTREHQVWSFTSKVRLKDGSIRHVPMMNFHPLDEVGIDDISRFIELSEPNLDGWLLESGRYYHFYGDGLMSEDEWIQFNARFLMPMILVRSRYIGHRLRDGYSTLRLTNDSLFKPTIPHVVRRVGKF